MRLDQSDSNSLPGNKKKLGKSAGIDVNTSCVAVLEAGDAKDLIKDLALKLAAL